MNPLVIDTTLRDGEQAPGVAFSADEKMRIARMLNDVGVDEIEAGTPAIGKEECEAIRRIASEGFAFITSAWCRARSDDLALAAGLGLGSVNISLPVSDIQIATLGKSRSWVIQQLKAITSQACELFPRITIGAQDASRAGLDFLGEFIFHAIDCGAHRIRITDTVGLSDPFEVQTLLNHLSLTFPGTEFEFHGHNDLGMATANTIAALVGGAASFSATVNGMGERAGNASLQELLAILHHKYGNTRFRTCHLTQLSQLVSSLSGRELPEDKPVTGAAVFTHESGIHTSAILKNVKSYQELNPADYGHSPGKFAWGKHAGQGALRDLLTREQLHPDEKTLEEFMQWLKSDARSSSGNITSDTITNLFRIFRQEEQPVPCLAQRL